MNSKEEMRQIYDRVVSKGVFYCPKCETISNACKVKRLQELEVKKKTMDVYDGEIDYGEFDCCDYAWDDVKHWIELGCGCQFEVPEDSYPILDVPAVPYLVFRQGFVYICKAEKDHKKVMDALHDYISVWVKL